MRLIVLTLLGTAAFAAAQTLSVRPLPPAGVIVPGQPAGWEVSVDGSNAAEVVSVRYEVKGNGVTPLHQGTLAVTNGQARLVVPPPDEPGSLLADFTAPRPGGGTIQAAGGLLFAPERLAPSLPRPADFDAFWNDTLAALAAVPADVQLEPGDSGRNGVDYWKLTLRGLHGRTIHAQLAKPRNGTNLPGLVVLQYAGVYALPKGIVTSRAAEGWLALNVMPHDLPLDETPEFYQRLAAGPLKNYGCQGNTNRATSYLQGILLAAFRATEYLASRPDWNRRTLVATGNSMGGYQALAVAALSSNVTAVAANVPAGCDHTAATAGRMIPWPYWTRHRAANSNADAIREASRYYDAVNFAPRLRVPVLVSLGLIDTSCPATGVQAMANQLAGPREIVVMPVADHKGNRGSHAPYDARAAVWLPALRAGQPAPVP